MFQKEPIQEESPLKKLNNVILTPHSATARESYPRAIRHAVKNIFRLKEKKALHGLAIDYYQKAKDFHQKNPEVDLMLPNV